VIRLCKISRNVTWLLLVGIVATAPTVSNAFEAGQRWSCVTDQGANAFMAVIDVKGDAVTFSWGAIDTNDGSLMSLCNKRDALSLREMKSFCRLLGKGVSDGHDRLSKACAKD